MMHGFFWRGARSLRVALLMMTLGALGVSGCAQNPASPSAASADEPVAERASSSRTPPPEKAAAAPLMSLKAIIRLIENGQDDEARAALLTFLKNDPKNAQALSLQRQLTTDPRGMMGAHTVKYTIQNGDTLGGLAQKYLGSSLKFVALARFNHIQRSRDLRVGQVIEVPAEAVSGASAPEEAAAAETPKVPASSITDSAAPPAPAKVEVATMPPPTEKSPILPSSPVPAVPTGNAKALEQRGMTAYKQKNWESAYTDLSAAVAASPGIEPATSTLAVLKPRLVRQYHEAALVDFRQQNLDQAIALWDKALAIDPNYEPALGYRARALEIKRRLNQLEQK